jgi:beta-glucanase (GH16 family)
MNRGDWTFGKIEFRPKVPAGEGIWPAVWVLPTNSRYGGWASGGEIDLLESRGSVVSETNGALHFGGPWPRNTFVTAAYKLPGTNAAEAFHLYGLEWSKDEIKWSVDSVVWQTRTRDEWFSEAARDNPSAPFDQPFHLIINLAVDGRFFEETTQRADNLPASAFPQILQIDYVRLSQWAD